MDELIELSHKMVKMLDNGDLMGCYSLYESDIRPMLPNFDESNELANLWKIQGANVDEEDWAKVIEHMESIRAELNE
tara:strand:+ start:5131 stop:5361 length:231 start_codon:yes stop_codon:yes gene_type:complete